jgi:hypothetical protein
LPTGLSKDRRKEIPSLACCNNIPKKISLFVSHLAIEKTKTTRRMSRIWQYMFYQNVNAISAD